MTVLLIKLGAMSVQVAVQAVVLKVALVVFVGMAGLFVWNWFK